MFWKRLLSAIVLIPIVLFLVWWGGYFYASLIACVAAFMLIEFSQLSDSTGCEGDRTVIVASGLLFCLSALTERISVELVLFLILFVAFANYIFRDKVDSALLSVANVMVGSVYIGWAFGYHLILLRYLSDSSGKSIGRGFVFFLLAVVWCGDIAAYVFGKWVGRHKLRPRISPGKTIEGTIAGLGCGSLSGIGVWLLLLRETLSLTHTLIVGLLLGIVGQISDLSESVIKRSADAKDSGRLIPGHGGLLDRCDSLVFSAPTLYYYFQYLIRNAWP